MLALVLLIAQADPKDYSDADLGLKWVSEKKEASGFIVGGKNPTALIKTLKEINGRPIADLEKDMRPGAAGEVGSRAGFLGPTESLLAVMAADNAYVVDELGLTHQALARPLRVFGAIGHREWKEAMDGKGHEFTYQGRRFRVMIVQFKGYQESPFMDDTRTDTDVTVENLDTKKSLKYSLLVPDLIERYGFYEGTGTQYRVAPKEALAVLDFIKPAK
jgi:hypothetical protein